MSIDKKFKMFSTKEWIQFLQYKLSPEREKELEVEMTKDAFLNDAVKTIGDKENRALSYQSIALLINEVQQYTGVSESKIVMSRENKSAEATAPINWKLIGIIVGAAMLIGLLGYGIYYFLSNASSVDSEEKTMIEAESVSNIQSYADSSAIPMETIPSAIVAASTPIDSIPAAGFKKPVKPKSNQSSQTSTNPVEDNTTSGGSIKPTSSLNPSASQKERDLFNQAQESFKQGNREEAKRMLRELKSYDNPMKSQAETILKNIEN
jgi:hypothetical protein